jgi:hypothetical protein
MKKINIRLLSGEIAGELFPLEVSGGITVEHESLILIMDLTMGVLARHIGEIIADDKEFPVEPLPFSQKSDKQS